MKECGWCSDDINKVSHAGGKCPKVRAIEYHKNGQVKRVEFFDDESRVVPSPYPCPTKTEPQPPYKITVGDNSSSWSDNVAWFRHRS